MTRIFIADVSCIDIEAFLGKVSPARREKTLRLSKDDDKRRSLGAEMLLIKAAGRDDYVLSKNEKPYFPDNEVFFSLAHCGDYAVCAVSDVPVGVDIELPRAGGSSLAKRFFRHDEAALVSGGETQYRISRATNDVRRSAYDRQPQDPQAFARSQRFARGQQPEETAEQAIEQDEENPDA